jgi:hypothetical protein
MSDHNHSHNHDLHQLISLDHDHDHDHDYIISDDSKSLNKTHDHSHEVWNKLIYFENISICLIYSISIILVNTIHDLAD